MAIYAHMHTNIWTQYKVLDFEEPVVVAARDISLQAEDTEP